MIDGGQEVIIEIIQDSQFEELVMFCSGGIELEGLDDVAFSIASLAY